MNHLNGTQILQLFRDKARALMPHQTDLQDVDFGLNEKSLNSIAEYAFREHGEYLGGMAEVIIAVIRRDASQLDQDDPQEALADQDELDRVAQERESRTDLPE